MFSATEGETLLVCVMVTPSDDIGGTNEESTISLQIEYTGSASEGLSLQ